MGQAERLNRQRQEELQQKMIDEANKRWRAKVTRLVPAAGPKGEVISEVVVTEFEEIFTPGQNRMGQMVFANEERAKYVPIGQIIDIDLEALPEKKVVGVQLAPKGIVQP